MKKFITIYLILIFGISQAKANTYKSVIEEAAKSESKQVYGLFENDDILDISLEFDVTEYMRKKSKKEYLDARIILNSEDNSQESYDIKVRARGNSRHELCSFPPLRIKLEGAISKYSDLDAINNIKLVTHCKRNSIYEDYIVKEYLAYKMYNAITDYSFRVRLLRISYIDTGKKEQSSTHYGFVIEPVKMLEERLEAREIENLKLKKYHFHNDAFDRMSVFQFMIGNTDWHVENYHNIKALKKDDEQLGYPIPYDFDYSGLINAYYSTPREALSLDNVRQRYFQGPCRDEAQLNEVFEEFSQAKEEIYKMLNHNDILSSKEKKYTLKYLDGFYKLLEKDRLHAVFNTSCND